MLRHEIERSERPRRVRERTWRTLKGWRVSVWDDGDGFKREGFATSKRRTEKLLRAMIQEHNYERCKATPVEIGGMGRFLRYNRSK